MDFGRKEAKLSDLRLVELLLKELFELHVVKHHHAANGPDNYKFASHSHFVDDHVIERTNFVPVLI